jgi:hypothetical protein
MKKTLVIDVLINTSSPGARILLESFVLQKEKFSQNLTFARPSPFFKILNLIFSNFPKRKREQKKKR